MADFYGDPFRITWRAEDIVSIREGWTLEQAENWLDVNWRKVQDRLIETGWEVLEYALPAEPTED